MNFKAVLTLLGIGWMENHLSDLFSAKNYQPHLERTSWASLNCNNAKFEIWTLGINPIDRRFFIKVFISIIWCVNMTRYNECNLHLI